MKLYKTMLAALALALGSVAFSSCSEDEEMPPITIPKSEWKANTTIRDFKKAFWKSDDNYYTEVPAKANGEAYVISGRVIGNDLTGNIYQNITIQDSTAAVCIAVAMKDMNVKYKIGEQVIVNCTGLYAGKYSGLFQIGRDELYNNTTPQVGKMAEETFVKHVQLNGFPQPDSIYAITMEIGDLNAMASNVDSVIKYQSQLIRLNNVSFKDGGTATWGDRGTSHNTRYLYNQQGQSIPVDNSGMSDFNDQTLPDGHGDIEAILSYFRTNWQLVFVTNEDCFNFGGENYAPVAPPASGTGAADDPYNVGAVIGGASGTNVWVTGYIVGWVDGQVLSSGAKFTTPATVTSNMLLAATPDEKSVDNCIPIALPNNTAVRTDLNLQNNPGNLGKEVTIRGNLTNYFGTKGVKEVNLYVWGDKGDDNATMGGGGGGGTVTGTGEANSPYNVGDVINGASGTNAWISGYIVGWVDGQVLSSGAKFTTPATVSSNLLLAASPDEKSVGNCIPVQLPANTDVRTDLNLQNNPGNLGKQVTIRGNLTNYFGTKGVKEVNLYVWGAKGDDNAAGGGGGSTTDPNAITFKKVTTITSGKQYLIVAEGKMAKVSTANYGYLYVDDATDVNGEIKAPEANAFTFTSTTGGYKIMMSDSRYLYQTGTYNSFNFSTAPNASEAVWTVVAQGDGIFKITNTGVNKYIQYDSGYTSYGSYPDQRGTLPALYERVN